MSAIKIDKKVLKIYRHKFKNAKVNILEMKPK